MTRIIPFAILLIIISCTESKKNNKLQTQTNTATLFESTLVAHGVTSFDESIIRFTIQGTQFEHKIDNGRPNIVQTRISNDKEHKATYYGGLIKYYINDTLQASKSYPVMMLERSLYGFLFTYTIPFSLRTNDINLHLLEDVQIRNKDYHTIKATITGAESENTDEIILYINKSNNYIEFVSLKHKLTSNVLQFRRMINPRVINGILFQDYIIFTPQEEGLPLEKLYTHYNSAQLKDLRTISLEAITASKK